VFFKKFVWILGDHEKRLVFSMAQLLFSCKALDALGVEVSSTVEAQTKEEVIVKLRKLNLFPKTIEVLDDTRFEIHKIKAPAKKSSLGGFFKEKKIPAKTLMVFTRQLATLLDAGLPLLRSLTMLQSQQQEGLFKTVLGELQSSIQSGETLSAAMAHYPHVFNRLFVKMVKAGELGGVLDIVLDRMAEFTEKAQRVKGKVKSAMMYPGIVLSIALIIVSGLLVFIVPKFEKIFSDMLGGRPLPFLTRMVVDSSNTLKDHAVFIIIFLALAYPLLSKLLKQPRVIRIVDKALYWMPLFGELVRMSAISQFARTLGTLITSGVPILQALNNTRETAGNTVVAEAIALIHDSVKQGETIKQAMEASGAFPSMVTGMIEVGEETGNLPKLLLKIADLYDEEVDTTVAGLTSLMEPIMIVLLALLIGTIVIALFLPLVGIISGLQE
jgi:type IV pilus assembly protein PilC